MTSSSPATAARSHGSGRENRAAGGSLGAAIILAVVFGVAGGSLQAAAFGFAAGYLLPLSGFLFVHFFRHHDEIRRLTAPSQTSSSGIS